MVRVWPVVRCVGVHLTSAGVPSGRVELFRSSLHCESEGDGQTDRQMNSADRHSTGPNSVTPPPCEQVLPHCRGCLPERVGRISYFLSRR